MSGYKLSIHDLTRIAFFAALTGILAYISFPLPFSPVPVSGQTLGVMLAGLLLGSYRGFLSQIAYILLGVIGLPVFAGGSSGIGSLFGPSGGYIWGFLFGAYIIGRLFESFNNSNYIVKFFFLVTGGIVVVYLFGITQLIIVTKMSLTEAIVSGMLPFLPGDLFKIFIVTLISQKGLISAFRTNR
ncbi:biotin transporter BioY [Halothermothrix orenii]|uniref:Biotin transporter n=1 Tax=Halothermothrix orenii (strain H 168 / OCM 544 / DSM 9562) TaxID=373903 RepID=B8D247_HALOH|nr:biotin transporter BioY [Halothermothrix orenii]ACL69274.1 BioY protein [Halothermothrix orenii H 168]